MLKMRFQKFTGFWLEEWPHKNLMCIVEISLIDKGIYERTVWTDLSIKVICMLSCSHFNFFERKNCVFKIGTI